MIYQNQCKGFMHTPVRNLATYCTRIMTEIFMSQTFLKAITTMPSTSAVLETILDNFQKTPTKINKELSCETLLYIIFINHSGMKKKKMITSHIIFLHFLGNQSEIKNTLYFIPAS